MGLERNFLKPREKRGLQTSFQELSKWRSDCLAFPLPKADYYPYLTPGTVHASGEFGFGARSQAPARERVSCRLQSQISRLMERKLPESASNSPFRYGQGPCCNDFMQIERRSLSACVPWGESGNERNWWSLLKEGRRHRR